MKTFKRPTKSRSFLTNFTNNSFTAIIAIVVLFGITAFISVEKTSQNNLLNPGVVFEVDVDYHDQSSPKKEEMQVAVEGRSLKMDILPRRGQDKGGKLIFRGDRGENGEFIMVDDDKKEYYLIDDAFINSMLGRTKQSKTMIDDALKHLTPEQRKMIEDAQKKSGTSMPGYMKNGSKPERIKTNEKKNISGYPCVKYVVELDNKKIRELWITTWSEIDGGREARDAFYGMNDFFQAMMDKIGDIPGSTNPYDEMGFEDGFPVVTEEFGDDGNLESTSTLRSAKRQTLDPDAFEPPSGYKREYMFPE